MQPAPEPEPVRERITLAIPEDVACKVEGSVRSATPLRFAANESPFGSVRKTDVLTAHVLIGNADRGIVVEAETKDVFIRGFAQASDIRFHPNRVAIFGGFLIPTASATLQLVRAAADGIQMRLELPSEVRMANRKSLEEKLECAGTSLDVQAFDPYRAYFPPRAGAGELRGSQIPIATSASGTPVGTLVLGADTFRIVAVLGREGRRVRIAWDLDDVIAVGWVDARAVQELPEGGGGRGEGIGLDSIATIGGCCAHIFVCDHEVPIRATLGVRSEIVGVSRSGVQLKAYGNKDARHELYANTFDGFVPAAGTKLSIDADRVAGCVDVIKQRGVP
jgi:hypothetical protein